MAAADTNLDEAAAPQAPGASTAAICIKVCWLKQQKNVESQNGQQPLLEFDETQHHNFDPASTSFKIVKHACSYPVPPHKVRMWCSSFGASPVLPA
eukprot:CAMPEP_0183369070 /NCGR_PEP_ID=MMETSP0164_2-20130417/98201_1 /TAXON_ID=221442 /ORGANISM="Coccolithus pelagicus ssp braarudi, Strain PLY182g" /LENGTH=95 /DNA_ID=CAMNT_0025545269 /DNA_START=97 /DNA_END=380 /DNA_ORIENTATION=+